MTTVEFGTLFEFIRNGMSVRQDKSGEGLPITRIETISEAVVDSARVGYAGLDENDCNGWLLQPGDILFSHINSVEHIGKCAVYEGSPEKLVHGMNLLCLRPDKSKLAPQFGKYLIRSNPFRSRLFNYVNKAVNQASVSIGNLKPIEVSVPSLPEQKRIAAILDKADFIRRKRQEAVRLTEELLRSVFLEMFGDPVTNPKGWETRHLGELGLVVSGLQVSSKRVANLEIPYLRVANVYRDKLMLDEIKTIQISPSEFERARLSKGDLLIVEGHGNPEEIGRSAVWDGSIDPCVHQNHLIRVSIDSKLADSRFVSAFLNSSGGRQQLFKSGKTTSGLNTINTTNVKNTQILMPPLPHQQKYVKLVERILSFQGKIESSAKQENTLFNSLLQSAFKGTCY